MDQKLTPRHRAILVAVVENYIATGEPVGSATIATALGPISSATIRNAMVELAAMGLLNQPHTSAGRVPTPSAFRFYVEQLSGNAAPPAPRPDIDDSFTGIDTTQSFLERTSHVLALLSSGVGVAITSPGTMGTDTLEHVHFSRLAPARVLAVVVMTSGLVRDRALTLDSDLDIAALESAAAFLNQNFRGFTIQAIRDELARRLEEARSDYQRTLASVNQLWQKSMPAEAPTPRQTVYIEGVANLLGSEADRQRLHGMMAALEEKQRIVDLLTAYVDTRQESVRVVFDLEEHAPEMRDLVLIAAPARLAGENHGAVGVIGPKRMQYERAMSAVSYISQLFDRMLQPPQ
ncbi:MAG TPA: heat-inducible transcriptional repressor HrcA [Acidobacteriaceae bacterium]|jgi:heat-inducible transcriptional repressor|nr:heat-inducible transcriptional repressor HrcA [Acidobacteriaceae bacterium]